MLTGGVDQVFARTTATGSQSLLTDALGSTLGLTDTTGALTAEYTYQPFGATTTTGNDTGNPTRFAGREDDGNGLYYNRARYYRTGNSRFLSQDPLGPAGGSADPYTYASNRPTAVTDPSGLKPRGDNVDLYHAISNAGARSIRENGVDPSYLDPNNPRAMDFGNGFYTTRDRAQAENWIEHHHGGNGEVLHFRFSQVQLDSLRSRTFTEGDPDLEGFVLNYRTSDAHAAPDYQMVEGPMLRNPEDFVAGGFADLVWKPGSILR